MFFWLKKHDLAVKADANLMVLLWKQCFSNASFVGILFPLRLAGTAQTVSFFFVSSCGEECAASAARTATHRIPATFSLCLFVHGFCSGFRHAEIDA